MPDEPKNPSPKDTLTIGGGGSIAVGTDVMLEASARLREVETELTACLHELASIDRLVTRGALSGSAASAPGLVVEREITEATRSLARAHTASGALHTALDRAADAYGVGDLAVRRASEEVAGGVAYGLGLMFPFVLAEALPVVIPTALIALVILTRLSPTQDTALKKKLVDFLRPYRAILSSSLFVGALRLTVMSMDEFGAGVARLPPGLARELSDAKITGVTGSAAAIVGAGNLFGLFEETAVSTKQISRTTAGGTLPVTWRDRADRLPLSSEVDDQVRIDRYEVPGQPDRFEVYISGTRDFDPTSGTQPWDLTSDLQAIAGGDAGSTRAVELAMKAAGIDAGSPVIFTGHSQGGLIAAQLAGSGDYNAQGLFTLGAPAAQVVVPRSVPWVALEHSNDLVPALSGIQRGSDPLIVSRDYVPAPNSAESDGFFPAHMLPEYKVTATMLDSSTEPRVVAVEQKFAAFTANAVPVETTTWQGIREK